MPVCEIDLRVGGAYRYVWRKEGQKDMGLGGVFQDIVPPERLVATERFDDAWYPGDALDTTSFAEDGAIFEMCFHHSELVLPVPSYTTRWRTIDHHYALAYHERILRLLHSHRPPPAASSRWPCSAPTPPPPGPASTSPTTGKT